MAMSRKDYVLIAGALNRAKPGETSHPAAHAQHRITASNIAMALAADNPRFDRSRFLDAGNKEA